MEYQMKQAVEAKRKEMVADCLEYHSALIKSDGPDHPVNADTLEQIIFDMDFTEWEDVAFFAGYLRAIQWIQNGCK